MSPSSGSPITTPAATIAVTRSVSTITTRLCSTSASAYRVASDRLIRSGYLSVAYSYSSRQLARLESSQHIGDCTCESWSGTQAPTTIAVWPNTVLYNPFPIMNTDIDRERGILSPADRAYLLGEREMSHEQSKRNARREFGVVFIMVFSTSTCSSTPLPRRTASRCSSRKVPTTTCSRPSGRWSRSPTSPRGIGYRLRNGPRARRQEL